MVRRRITNIGMGFETPNGSRQYSSSACPIVMSAGESSHSASSVVFRSIPLKLSLAQSFSLLLNSGRFSRFIVSPAASSCPPNFSSKSEHSDSASTRFSPFTLLPEPLPKSSPLFSLPFPSNEISIDGQAYFSVILDATMPMIPWCHSSSSRIIIGSRSKSCSASMRAYAWSTILFSSFCLSRLMSHSFFAMGAAVSQSSAKNSFTAIDASLILPAAFILGAIVYPMNEVVIFRLV